ncbi:hypothetical protein [Colwellia sp. PAMC 21821]|uniref:hypothetical protein n=1 Tax=Colwellia sp. PAMC 21821 TaxID=1816219 RepID=UPI0009C00A90|nr:hypothetical protein [Colwellia sp. PAMC 21821]ARD44352.1 hypothetical protein A3Q33_08520 [Colwellia sp. PAMC 21821]
MSYNKNQQDTIFSTITTPLGDELTWRWEEKQSALLAEFSWEKKDRILTILRRLLSEEWHKKNIRKAPESLKAELGELANLNKEQLIFTKPATEETPALAVIWWPWGHGATYSMRIKILNSNYDDAALELGKASLITKVIHRIKSR